MNIVSPLNHEFQIKLEDYTESKAILPKTGQQIICYRQDDFIVVYQAFRESIARFAVENQKFGGDDFSFSRMSWIKPNFLWMMYRCGWGEKDNQKRVLAIWITKTDLVGILNNSVRTTFTDTYYETEREWQKELRLKNVRLQWDPDHNPSGNPINRKAIQLGLKGDMLEKFARHQIQHIMDITPFVSEQKVNVDAKALDKLLVPVERVLELDNTELERRIGICK